MAASVLLQLLLGCSAKPASPHLTATMCFATASGPSRSVSHARTVRAFSIVSAVVNVLLYNNKGEEQRGQPASSPCAGPQCLAASAGDATANHTQHSHTRVPRQVTNLWLPRLLPT